MLSSRPRSEDFIVILHKILFFVFLDETHSSYLFLLQINLIMCLFLSYM
jgi:hypothetical protein